MFPRVAIAVLFGAVGVSAFVAVGSDTAESVHAEAVAAPSRDLALTQYTGEGTGSDLGTLGGARSSANKASDGGQVVGWSLTTTGETHAVVWNPVVDTTPPVITVPTDITVNATSPTGEKVDFTVTATDENPANPDVTCTPPSGSVFPIGTTIVTCTATDAAGNTATATFTVHVKGAGEQLGDLANAVISVGPGTSLVDKATAAQAAYTAGDTARTCEILNAFINQVTAQRGKSIPDPGTADTLINDAKRIRAVLGC